MKQGTLNFTSSKRTSYAVDVKSKKSAAPQLKRAEEQITRSSKDEEPSTVLVEISSDEDSPVIVPSKRTRGTLSKKDIRGTKSTPKKTKDIPTTPERETLDVEDKAGRYRRYYNEVRKKMDYMSPIHANGQNKIHLMLRYFDMSEQYGPCVGMTRLERWERAESLGLEPPPEVQHILLTKEGTEKDEYAQGVLHGEV